MVASEVEEGRDVEDHPVHPAEHQRVAGHLHRTRLDTALAHDREEPVEVGRLGGGELGLHIDPGDAGADRAHDGGGQAGGAEALLEDAGGGRLALGAGDADDGQVGGRVAVDPGREPAQHATGLRHDEGGYAAGQALQPGRVGQHDHRSRGHGLLGEVRTVGAGAREGGVHVTRSDPRGAQRDARDDGVEVAVALDVGETGEPVGEVDGRRRRRLLRPRHTRLVHLRRVSSHHSTGSRDGLPSVGATP